MNDYSYDNNIIITAVYFVKCFIIIFLKNNGGCRATAVYSIYILLFF